MSYFENVNAFIRNIAGIIINPATEEKQDDSNLSLLAINTKQSDNTQTTQIVDADGTMAKVEARVQTPTGNALNVQIGPGDPISNIPVVMEFEHHQVHEGETYRVESIDTSLDSGTVKYAIVVPAGSYPHMELQCDVYNGSTLVQIYEEATYTGGSLLSSINRNRNSSNLAETTVVGGITSTNGTLLESFYAGSGKGIAGTNRASSEIILKANTTYRIDLIGKTVGTDAILSFNWYEDLGV